MTLLFYFLFSSLQLIWIEIYLEKKNAHKYLVCRLCNFIYFLFIIFMSFFFFCPDFKVENEDFHKFWFNSESLFASFFWKTLKFLLYGT